MVTKIDLVLVMKGISPKGQPIEKAWEQAISLYTIDELLEVNPNLAADCPDNSLVLYEKLLSIPEPIEAGTYDSVGMLFAAAPSIINVPLRDSVVYTPGNEMKIREFIVCVTGDEE